MTQKAVKSEALLTERLTSGLFQKTKSAEFSGPITPDHAAEVSFWYLTFCGQDFYFTCEMSHFVEPELQRDTAFVYYQSETIPLGISAFECDAVEWDY